MNKKSILQTAVCKDEEGTYVVESPLLENCIGAAGSKKAAWEHFEHHVNVAYTAYLEGRLTGMYDHPGRPAKNREPMTLRVKSETKQAISHLAETFECSQGEIADFLVVFWQANSEPRKNSRAATKSAARKVTRKARLR